MKRMKLFVVVMVAVLLAAMWMPAPLVSGGVDHAAAASPMKMLVQNKTGLTVNLTLTGPTLYNLTIPPGKSTQLLLPGLYTYSHMACGKKVTAKINFKTANQQLVLKACPNIKMAKVTIQNNTGGYLTLYLNGPVVYNFTLKAGKTVITVRQGTYKYTAWGCGGASDSGTKKLRNGVSWRWFCIG
jgi:hypothetical protein